VRNIAFGFIIGLTTFATVAFPGWIELLTGWDPDRHDGSIERSVVAVLLTIVVLTLALAVMKRRTRAASPLRSE
jgi:hypothetical protein